MGQKQRGGEGEVENLQAGMEELLALADESGPPEERRDLGNFGEDSTPTGNRQPPARQRQPERLQTAEEEILERQVRGEQVGKRTERVEREELPEDDEPVDEREERVAARREDDAPADDAEPVDDEPVDDAEPEDEPREARGRREPAWARELREQNAYLRGLVEPILRGRAQPAQPEAPKPPASEPITLDNVLPFRLGPDFIETLRTGDVGQAANLLDLAVRTAVFHGLNRGGEQVRALVDSLPKPEAVIAQREALARTQDAIERAFYKKHRDIDQQKHGRLVDLVSADTKRRLEAEGRFTTQAWIDETAHETRRLGGIKRQAQRGSAADIERDVERSDERRGNVRQIRRPAFSESGVSTGRATKRAPVTGEQKEILDLVRFG